MGHICPDLPGNSMKVKRFLHWQEKVLDGTARKMTKKAGDDDVEAQTQ